MEKKIYKTVEAPRGTETKKMPEYIRCPGCMGTGRACPLCEGLGVVDTCEPCARCEYTGYLRNWRSV